MPPVRTLPTSAKPLKTERTHEENQERAYIAASRRSDRSLEARIESARRASEIHKKRTGRGLRVTEQDVANEEMYEEEEEDMPTQFQRLSAHFHTNSLLFNRKLSDYIATQTAVRNQFLQQYSALPLQGFGQQFPSNLAQVPSQTVNPYMTQQQMAFPQMFNRTPQTFNQSSPPYSPQTFHQPQLHHRQAPYSIPQRPQAHQRSASIPTFPSAPGFQQTTQLASPTTETSYGEGQRRMSLPPQILEQSTPQMTDDLTRPPLSQSTTSQSGPQQASSLQRKASCGSTTPPSAHDSPISQAGNPSSTTYSLMAPNYATSNQSMNTNPLSMSLPPESQQFVGSTLDPTDPLTPMFMAGSDRIPQPFTSTYTYNPNLSPKASRSGGSGNPTQANTNQALTANAPINIDTAMHSTPSPTNPNSAVSDLMSPFMTMPPSSFDFLGYDLFQNMDMAQNGGSQGSQEEFDTSTWLDDSAWEAQTQ
ncbi:hypothetical protein CC78DRAFT_380543 [Lojkania enalia]|uniref:Uncharacterized protein n=1 Tax=Lojkania enalia TaxID=147567 RepID=A0A9P4K3V3_9PLEO|nr:hypothetical protein CC78DRAFT_380543 [Didymosphaeria enalia]